jgi:hypothetical protein
MTGREDRSGRNRARSSQQREVQMRGGLRRVSICIWWVMLR